MEDIDIDTFFDSVPFNRMDFKDVPNTYKDSGILVYEIINVVLELGINSNKAYRIIDHFKFTNIYQLIDYIEHRRKIL